MRAGSRSRGASFVEIVLATAILAGALVPIASMLIGTAGQSASTKAEAAAAGYAARMMTLFLDDLDFDDLALEATAAGRPHRSEDAPGGNAVVDGTEIRWELEVAVVPNDRIFFRHHRIRYHRPDGSPATCPGGAEGQITDANVLDPDVSREVNGANPTEASLDQLDRKNAGVPVLKELRLTIQWKTPRDEGFEDPDAAGPKTRTVALLTRRGRLGRRAP